MCFERTVHFSCQHRSTVSRPCVLAGENPFYFRLGCPAYEYRIEDVPYKCGVGKWYCNDHPSSGFLNLGHQRQSDLENALRDLNERSQAEAQAATSWRQQVAAAGMSPAEQRAHPQYSVYRQRFLDFSVERNSLAADLRWAENWVREYRQTLDEVEADRARGASTLAQEGFNLGSTPGMTSHQSTPSFAYQSPPRGTATHSFGPSRSPHPVDLRGYGHLYQPMRPINVQQNVNPTMGSSNVQQNMFSPVRHAPNPPYWQTNRPQGTQFPPSNISPPHPLRQMIRVSPEVAQSSPPHITPSTPSAQKKPSPKRKGSEIEPTKPEATPTPPTVRRSARTRGKRVKYAESSSSAENSPPITPFTKKEEDDEYEGTSPGETEVKDEDVLPETQGSPKKQKRSNVSTPSRTTTRSLETPTQKYSPQELLSEWKKRAGIGASPPTGAPTGGVLDIIGSQEPQSLSSESARTADADLVFPLPPSEPEQGPPANQFRPDALEHGGSETAEEAGDDLDWAVWTDGL